MEEKKTCESCNAACCRYVALEIDTPETLKDFEDIRWYVAHKNIHVYVEEDGTWNLEFITPCEHLREDNHCDIHEMFVENPKLRRPAICGDFDTSQCPHHNPYKEMFSFRSIEDVDKYIEEIFNKGLHVLEEDEEY